MSFLDTIRTTVANLRDDTDTTIRNAVKKFNVLADIDGHPAGVLATVTGLDAASAEVAKYANVLRKKSERCRVYTEVVS